MPTGIFNSCEEPLKIYIDNIPNPQKPTPIVNNYPLEDYVESIKKLDNLYEKVKKYERFIEGVFGHIIIVDRIDFNDCRVKTIENQESNEKKIMITIRGR